MGFFLAVNFSFIDVALIFFLPFFYLMFAGHKTLDVLILKEGARKKMLPQPGRSIRFYSLIEGIAMFKINPDRLFSVEEAGEKREQLLSMVMDSIKQVHETDAGYHLRFSPENEDIVLVSDWVQAERLCNPFLRFMMSVESNKGPVSCELGGPAGTKAFLSSALSLNRWL